MRQARVEVLFKDYEDAIEHLESEVYTLKQENKYLEEKLKHQPEKREAHAQDGKKESPTGGADTAALLALTRKLQDASAAYEKVKKEMNLLKKENVGLKDENCTLTRENQKLRLDLVNRSPRRYGRLTVATLENKVETYEKEVKQLERALERSDAYVEEMEDELKDYRMRIRCLSACSKCSVAMDTVANNCRPKTESSDKRTDELEKDTHITKPSGKDSEPESPPTPSKFTSIGFYGKRPSLPAGASDSKVSNSDKKLTLGISSPRSLRKTTTYSREDLMGSGRKKQGMGQGGADSFTFELPSPTTPSTSLGKLSLETKSTSSTSKSTLHLPSDDSTTSSSTATSSLNLEAPSINDSSVSTASLGSCRKKLKFDTSSLASDVSLEKGKKKSSRKGTMSKEGKCVDFDSKRNKVYELSSASSSSETLNESSMNASMAEDINDCMALLEAAEKKVGERRFQDGSSNSATWDVYHNSDATFRPSTASSSRQTSSATGEGGLLGGSNAFVTSLAHCSTSVTSVPSSGSVTLTSQTGRTSGGGDFVTNPNINAQDPFAKYFSAGVHTVPSSGPHLTQQQTSTTARLESMLEKISSPDNHSNPAGKRTVSQQQGIATMATGYANALPSTSDVAIPGTSFVAAASRQSVPTLSTSQHPGLVTDSLSQGMLDTVTYNPALIPNRYFSQ